jgi:hypothetical protein
MKEELHLFGTSPLTEFVILLSKGEWRSQSIFKLSAKSDSKPYGS